MDRVEFNVRVKRIIKERIKLMAKQEKRTVQDITEEIMELGIIEYLKGGKL